MLAGSMMIPEPIMLIVTMNVSCVTLIFFLASAMALSPEAADCRPTRDDWGTAGDAAARPFRSWGVQKLTFVENWMRWSVAERPSRFSRLPQMYSPPSSTFLVNEYS